MRRKSVSCKNNYCGFAYDKNIDYELNNFISIGKMNYICKWCHALKWKGESEGMCCKSGRVILPPLAKVPEPLFSLMNGKHESSEHFLDSMRKYNSCFQMTSFGANLINEGNFMPTFKVQGQVYHQIGSLFPLNSTPAFLQIYFVGDEKTESDIRYGLFSDVDYD